MSFHAGFLEARRPDFSLADEVRNTMCGLPRSLPTAIAFDAIGHALYARVTALPQYVSVRAELELLSRNAKEILRAANHPREIVDLHAGSAAQSRVLLHDTERFIVIDPCRPVLDDTVDGLEAAFPHLTVDGIVGDPAFGVAASTRSGGARLAVLLDSYIGRFDPTMARLELARIRSYLEPEDRLLIGVDLAKCDGGLTSAYEDSGDVYPAFVRNALRRMNREVGTDFRPADWQLVVEGQPEHGRVEVRFEARDTVNVSGGKVGRGWDFAQGETLIVEHAYKPSEGQAAAIAFGAGFEVVQSWVDAPEGYGLFLLAP